MNWRNPTFNAFGTIDCEIDHPRLGWIPFTCDPEDTGAKVDTAAMFAAMEPHAAPYVPPQAPPPTAEDFEAAIQAHIDATAGERGYRSGDACASYAGSGVAEWAAEAAAFVAWRDAVWQKAFADMGGEVGTPSEYVATLPAIEWPGAT